MVIYCWSCGTRYTSKSKKMLPSECTKCYCSWGDDLVDKVKAGEKLWDKINGWIDRLNLVPYDRDIEDLKVAMSDAWDEYDEAVHPEEEFSDT